LPVFPCGAWEPEETNYFFAQRRRDAEKDKKAFLCVSARDQFLICKKVANSPEVQVGLLSFRPSGEIFVVPNSWGERFLAVTRNDSVFWLVARPSTIE